MLNKVILLLLVFIFSFNKTDAGWEKIFLGSDRIRVLHFFNYNSGYAVSYSGIVFKTTNAGINWSSNALGKNVYAGEFFNDSNYILTGNNEFNNGWIGVFKNNIRTDFIIYPELLFFLHFFSASWIDINTGFVAGCEFDYSGQLGKIYKTTNSGLNWINISTPSGLFVNDIKFLNISKGFVLDPSAKFTTNSGINWTLCENSSVGGIKFDLVNEDTMYIAGYNGALFFSSNGGNNWTNRSPGNYSLCDVKFSDARTGWVCGLNGKIFKTTNAGELWNIQSSNTLNGLWCIFVADDNNVLIGGDSGIILKTTNGGITGFRNESNEIANKFILEQNFPNPFNSTTNIQFEVPGLKFVKIVVYDMLGREVKTLVNEVKSPGKYVVSFAASGLSSGVFFYKMTAGGFSSTKKLVLIQ